MAERNEGDGGLQEPSPSSEKALAYTSSGVCLQAGTRGYNIRKRVRPLQLAVRISFYPCIPLSRPRDGLGREELGISIFSSGHVGVKANRSPTGEGCVRHARNSASGIQRCMEGWREKEIVPEGNHGVGNDAGPLPLSSHAPPKVLTRRKSQ